MSLKLHVIHAREFIRTTPQHELDLAASKHMLSSIATAAQDMEQYDILLDFRETSSVHLSTTDVWELAAELDHHGSFRLRKTAVLIPETATGERAEFFKLCAENRGFSVNVFKDFEEAINWLFPASTLSIPEAQSH